MILNTFLEYFPFPNVCPVVPTFWCGMNGYAPGPGRVAFSLTPCTFCRPLIENFGGASCVKLVETYNLDASLVELLGAGNFFNMVKLGPVLPTAL